MTINPAVVRQQIENLRVAHPELIDDDESWLLAIESETDLDAVLTKIVREIEDTKALEAGTKERLEELEGRGLLLFLQQRGNARSGTSDDDLALQFNQLFRQGLDAIRLGTGPSRPIAWACTCQTSSATRLPWSSMIRPCWSE